MLVEILKKNAAAVKTLLQLLFVIHTSISPKNSTQLYILI